MNEESGWVRRGSRYLYRSKWFHLRQDNITLPNGDDITYTFVEHGGWVMVVPLLADGRVVMERIYRYTVQRWMLECPSGGLDGEAPEIAARRELEEETGYRAAQLERLGFFYGSDGISNEAFTVYLATGLTPDGTIHRENTEQMEIELFPIEELHTMAVRGEILDGPTSLSILLAWNRLHARADGGAHDA